MYDAAVRYGCRLDEFELPLDENSLLKLLHFSKIPAFRDQIKKLYVLEPISHSEEWTAENEDPHHLTSDLHIVLERKDAAMAHYASPEMIHLLAECFRNLRHAKMLSEVELRSMFGQTVILSALQLAEFPRQIANLRVSPGAWIEQGEDVIARSPSAVSKYASGLVILVYEEPHARNYRPDHPILHRLIEGCKDSRAIEVQCCSTGMRLRLCHTCQHLFTNNIARYHYSSLSAIKLGSMYISGGRLRRFVKDHAGTLTKVDFKDINLTDGTWRSIFQGLRKVPGLESVNLDFNMRQKTAFPLTDRLPSNLTNCDDFDRGGEVTGRDYVREFLLSMLKYFHTTLASSSSYRHYPWSVPIYYEVCRYKPSYIPSVDVHHHTLAALKRYAEEVG
jgi:hypothetical protein